MLDKEKSKNQVLADVWLDGSAACSRCGFAMARTSLDSTWKSDPNRFKAQFPAFHACIDFTGLDHTSRFFKVLKEFCGLKIHLAGISPVPRHIRFSRFIIPFSLLVTSQGLVT